MTTTALDDIRERLDAIETLSFLIARNHGDLSLDRASDLTNKEICKLALLIMELSEQADEMLDRLQVPASDLPKLNAYDPQYANAKVSLTALWKHLEALDAAAGDPAKVKAWGEKLWDELEKCEVVR